MNNPSSDRILSIAAVITAVAAVSVSVWQVRDNQRHNRLTVKPKLVIVHFMANVDQEIGFVISNKGAGPALIKTWDISVRGDPVGKFRDGWVRVLNRMKEIDHTWVHYGAFEMLEPGESRPILSVTKHDWAGLGDDDRKAFTDSLLQISLVITYESIYGELSELRFPK